MRQLTKLAKFQLRFIFFRVKREEMLGLGWPHFYWGLVVTWLAGMGRWWDDPNANIGQLLGLGSVAYVFVLAALLFVIVRPLVAPDWTYFRSVALIMFTSPLAWLYAIPVERFWSVEAAISINAWFLAIVALWRVLLLLYILRKLANFNGGDATIAAFLLITVIVFSLWALNLHGVVFQIMGGLRDKPPANPHEGEFAILGLLTFFSILGTLLFAPLWMIRSAVRQRIQRKLRTEKERAADTGNQSEARTE